MIWHLALGFWLGGAFVTYQVCEAPGWQRPFSALLWFTYPLWLGK